MRIGRTIFTYLSAFMQDLGLPEKLEMSTQKSILSTSHFWEFSNNQLAHRRLIILSRKDLPERYAFSLCTGTQTL